jgi:hypothetical protein
MKTAGANRSLIAGLRAFVLSRFRDLPGIAVSIASSLTLVCGFASAEPPHASYIFPAGGQRGTSVPLKVGGHFLHERCAFEMLGPGIIAPTEIARTKTVWFEGPLIKQPASQQAEDYPQDYAGQLQIAADAPLDSRWWRCWNAQGVTTALPFVVGHWPEVVEQEIEGDPVPVAVTLPVTINGRIFPRQDIDVWWFDAQAGQSITCAVAARELGSPLVARLDVRDSAGKVLAESTGNSMADAKLRFVVPASGRYAVHIADVASGGLQHYVYRLSVTAGPWVDQVYPLGGRRGSQLRLETVGQGIAGGTIELTVPEVEPGIIERPLETPAGLANVLRLEVSDLPESLEVEPNDAPGQPLAVVAPCVLNGRIQSPGDVDLWEVSLAKGKAVRLALSSSRLGSPLLAVVSIRDEAGKPVGQIDATGGEIDRAAIVTPPDDGKYLIAIGERFAQRGGPAFVYRLTIDEPREDFRIYVPDSLSVEVGGQQKLPVTIERQGIAKAPLVVHVEGLPPGVTCEDVQIPLGSNKAELIFKCAPGTAVTSANLRIVGRTELKGQMLEREALWAGSKDGFGRGEPVPCRLAITLGTPFRFTAQYSLIYAARGGTLRKRYSIDRGGFAGTLVAQLADRQGRHLQGVTGPVVEIPAGATEFEYPLQLPSWMELGRTSRTNLMLTGELQDAAGAIHKVCFTTRDQNEQLIALVTAGALRISLDRPTYPALPSRELAISVAIRRDASVTSQVRVELVVPPHIQGITAEPVIASPDQESATLLLKLDQAPGPLNMPLTIRAVAERGGDPLTAETPLVLVK